MPDPVPAGTRITRRSVTRAAGNLSRTLIGVYAVTVIFFLLVRGVIGEGWWPVALGNSLLHLLLMLALVLLPLCLFARRWGLSLALLPLVVTFALSYGAFFTTRAASAAVDGPAITLLTYNLYAASPSFDAIVEVIRQANADIVALQEVSPAAAERLAAEFADAYPYRALHPGESNGILGQGVLSRYPITADDYWRVYLAHQRVQLDVDGMALVLYNTHPIQPLAQGFGGFAMRAEEIAQVLQRAAGESAPVLIAGDLNMADQSEAYGRITQRYRDSYREVGWGMGFTWPALTGTGGPGALRLFALLPPLMRLDYVFHSDHLRALEARVWRTSGGSDHRPVWVRLALVGSG